jgi:hypothetical protein
VLRYYPAMPKEKSSGKKANGSTLDFEAQLWACKRSVFETLLSAATISRHQFILRVGQPLSVLT